MSSEPVRVDPHLSRRVLHDDGTIAIADVCCRAPRHAEAGEEEASTGHSFAFVRRGAFRRRIGRRAFTADANHAVFFTAGEPYLVAHPVDGGDDCTVFRLPASLCLEIAAAIAPRPGLDEARPFPFAEVPVAPELFRAQYELRARLAGREADTLEATESAMDLLAALLHGHARELGMPPVLAVRNGTRSDHRERVEAAKVLLASRIEAPPPLAEIAHAVLASPFHFARLFRRETGLPVHRYAQRLRLRAAAECLADGARDLTAVALALGFADHAHLTNAFRREFGLSPARFRAGLARGSTQTRKILQAGT